MYTLQIFWAWAGEYFPSPEKPKPDGAAQGKEGYSPNVFRSGLGLPCNHYFQPGTA